MKIATGYHPSISIGQMRNIVQLLRPTNTTGTRNNIVVTYSSTDVYAKVDPGGNERALQQAGLTYDDIIIVVIRFDGEVKNNWKIGYNNKQYTIHTATNIDAVNRFIKIMAYTKTA